MNDLSLFEDQNENKTDELPNLITEKKNLKVLCLANGELKDKEFYKCRFVSCNFFKLNLFHANLKTALFSHAI